MVALLKGTNSSCTRHFKRLNQSNPMCVTSNSGRVDWSYDGWKKIEVKMAEIWYETEFIQFVIIL